MRNAGTKKLWITSCEVITSDRLAERHVQLVDLAPAVAVLELPHPLLGDHVDRQRVGRRRGTARRSRSAAQTKMPRKISERRQRPGDLEARRAAARRRALRSARAPRR